jgi:hypothetical protein
MSPSPQYFAIPFFWSDDGELVPHGPEGVQDEEEARGLAFEMAMTGAGALAYRTERSNPRYQDAVILVEFGEVSLRKAESALNPPALIWWAD